MSSLNLSVNGASIKSSYNGVINGPAPSSSSPTYAQWALFSVQAPLVNAFQDSGNKESVLKVQDTGEGELSELNEDFSEGRVQYAFVKVKDPNTGLPKYVLIAWCGGGVPERTKGYFTSHTAAVSKVLHGYHVQITARSDSDLEPEAIMQKVADASGAKYSAGSSAGTSAPPPPPIKSKPVFTPTTSGATRNPLVAARSRKDDNVDEDGWGADAPPVTRTQVEKVESAYKPTRVNISELTQQKPEPSRVTPARQDDTPADVVKGGYQPVGKVDIAALRAQSKRDQDDRPTVVKGAYEPVGKVDIAAIRAKSKGGSVEPPPPQEPAQSEESEQSRSLADRASAFSQPAQAERLTTLPKPKVAGKFGGGGSFAGTKAPTPGGFGAPAAPAPPPVGAASRTFADQGGKTPAQLWAEKKAKERGVDVASVSAPAPAPAVETQKSGGGGWQSGYTGKSWAPVQTSGAFGRPDAGQISRENTGEPDQAAEQPQSGVGVSALKDRFKDAPPMGAGAPPVPRGQEDEPGPSPPPVPDSSRPSGGFALPGLPSRPAPAGEEEDEDDPSAYQPEPERDTSPPRVAIPVSRGADPELEEDHAPPPIAPSEINVPREQDLQDEREQEHQARAAAETVAEQEFAPEQVDAAQHGDQGGHVAVVQYDYEKAEDNEIELIEGDYVTEIDMIDEGWWMGTNNKGERGLFPCNYVELVEEGAGAQETAAAPPPPAPRAAPSAGPTATALYDYEAGEDNEISFPEDAVITALEFPDEDWWAGEYMGKKGLFPANYVQLNQ